MKRIRPGQQPIHSCEKFFVPRLYISPQRLYILLVRACFLSKVWVVSGSHSIGRVCRSLILICIFNTAAQGDFIRTVHKQRRLWRSFAIFLEMRPDATFCAIFHFHFHFHCIQLGALCTWHFHSGVLLLSGRAVHIHIVFRKAG